MTRSSPISFGKTCLNTVLSAAFRVRLVSDVPERLCQLRMRPLVDGKRRRMIEAIRERGVLFIHVPKNAGTSICHELYGLQVKHSTLAYYEALAPDLLDLPSFAIMRDPVDRFLSAFHYARAGGTRDRLVAPAFRGRYMRFSGVDDALEHMARSRSIFEVDHMFRPQHWYLTDREGRIAIDHLVPYGELCRINELPISCRLDAVPRLNAGKRSTVALKVYQESFIRDFYRHDYEVLEMAAARQGQVAGLPLRTTRKAVPMRLALAAC